MEVARRPAPAGAGRAGQHDGERHRRQPVEFRPHRRQQQTVEIGESSLGGALGDLAERLGEDALLRCRDALAKEDHFRIAGSPDVGQLSDDLAVAVAGGQAFDLLVDDKGVEELARIAGSIAKLGPADRLRRVPQTPELRRLDAVMPKELTGEPLRAEIEVVVDGFDADHAAERVQTRARGEGVSDVEVRPACPHEARVGLSRKEPEPDQEHPRLLRAEQADQLAPQLHPDRGALHDDAAAVQADRAVDRVEDQARQQFADSRLAAAIEQLRRLEKRLHGVPSVPLSPGRSRQTSSS